MTNTLTDNTDELKELLKPVIMGWRHKVRRLEQDKHKLTNKSMDVHDAEINEGLADDLATLITAREQQARLDEIGNVPTYLDLNHTNGYISERTAELEALSNTKQMNKENES